MSEYDKLAKHYFERRTNLNRFDYNRDIEVPALIKMIGNVKDKIILDMGCGFGDHAEKLSKQKFKRLFGFDKCKKFIKLAKEKNIPNTEFYTGDMNKRLKYPDSFFDIVYSSLAVHYIKDLRKLFKEVKRVLKKDGIFCFSTGHPIFNIINETDKHIIGVEKINGKQNINGNYFDERKKEIDLGSLGKVKLFNYTFETLIKSGLKNGLELIDYVDALPIKKAKKLNPLKYKLTTTLPTFILFKFRKI